MKQQLISIQTTRYSQVFRRFLEAYAETCNATIDGRKYDGAQFPQLIRDWAANKNIRGTRDFKLSKGNIDLVGFHDSPNELWVAVSELPFVEQLAAERLLRFTVTK